MLVGPALPPYTGLVYKTWHSAVKRWYARIVQPPAPPKIQTWAKYVYETTTKERIPVGLVVDHKSEDRSDDNFSNLQLLTAPVNTSKHSKLCRTKAMVELRCPFCEKIFTKLRRKTHLVKDSQFTLCSASCMGYWFHAKFSGVERQRRISVNVIREFAMPADGFLYSEYSEYVPSINADSYSG